LEDSDEKADLNLSRILQKTVESGCALSFGENFEPCRNRKKLTITENEEERLNYIARWHSVPTSHRKGWGEKNWLKEREVIKAFTVLTMTVSEGWEVSTSVCSMSVILQLDVRIQNLYL